MTKCYVVEAQDKISYWEGLELQNLALNRVRALNLPGILILLQHKPVVTIGRAGGWDNLLAAPEKFKQLGIEIHESDRGGNVTYHGPGQLVGYPVLNLAHWQKDLHWYLRSLEQVIINTLHGYGITAGRKREYTGVWVKDKKITAIGISVKNWITRHGFAFQITREKIEHFKLINPCGITDFGVVSLEELLPRVDFEKAVLDVQANFARVFGCTLERLPLAEIRGYYYGNKAKLAYRKSAEDGFHAKNAANVQSTIVANSLPKCRVPQYR